MALQRLERAFPVIVYPATVAFCLALYALLLNRGQAVAVSSNAPVFLAALLVTLFEWAFPQQRSWRPGRGEVVNDVWFMTLVQMLLPKLFMLWAALALAGPLGDMGRQAAGLWPHHWPLALQVVLMLVGAEFLRYWLHRAAHTLPLLWRLHAVHHSPDKLYWLNVGRFHPLEKGLQFFTDALPFLLLGVADTVVGAYFVFYAVNGFFQHSNIRLRYGPLNYLISTAELHRWHHSRIPQESNNNYGNNLIIWDLLFGTWFLPKTRAVGELGLLNRRYPRSFADQMLTPLVSRLSDEERPFRGVRDLLSQLAAHALAHFRQHPAWRRFETLSHDPVVVQQKLLKQIITQNRDTPFGRQHGFAQIQSYEDFREQVPVQTYDSLRPFIEARGLTREAPCLYARTSGTTGEPKLLPVLPSTLRRYREQQQLLAYRQFLAAPAAFSGKALILASPAVEGHLADGTPYGSVSGYFYQHMPALVRRRYLLPPAVFSIPDYGLRYQAILVFALGEPRLSYLAGANPSSFLRLLDVLNEQRRYLIEEVENGGKRLLQQLPQPISHALSAHLKPKPQRAAELRALDDGQRLDYHTLWPAIRLVTTWMGGSCGLALAALRNTLPKQARIFDLGYVASELRGTLPLDAETNGGVPAFHHYFFEFVEQRCWEEGRPEFLTLDRLAPGNRYYVLVTSQEGLYRYFMNDLLEVCGHFNRTPLLRFLQKGKGVTNITGEKLYESQVIAAVDTASQALATAPLFYTVLADEEQQRYHLFFEPQSSAGVSANRLAGETDRALAALNIEYREKRASGRLEPLTAHLLRPGTGEAYKLFFVERGQREAQFKPSILHYARDCEFDFEAHEAVEL